MQLTLQRKTELAMRALRTLAEHGATLSGGELASRLETTQSYLPQVMASLVAAGWVTSGRGPNGGYTLQDSSEPISMLALIEASEGPVASDRCVLRGGPCGRAGLCGMHDAWQQAQAALLRELEHIQVLQLGTGRE